MMSVINDLAPKLSEHLSWPMRHDEVFTLAWHAEVDRKHEAVLQEASSLIKQGDYEGVLRLCNRAYSIKGVRDERSKALYKEASEELAKQQVERARQFLNCKASVQPWKYLRAALRLVPNHPEATALWFAAMA